MLWSKLHLLEPLPDAMERLERVALAAVTPRCCGESCTCCSHSLMLWSELHLLEPLPDAVERVERVALAAVTP